MTAPSEFFTEFPNLWKQALKKLVGYDYVSIVNIPPKIHGGENPLWRLPLFKTGHRAYFQTVVGTWTDFYLKKVKNSIQKDSRRQYARLAKIGPISFLDVNDEQKLEMIRLALDFKLDRLRSQNRHSVLEREEVRRFYQTLPSILSNCHDVTVSTMFVGNQVVAIHLGVRSQKRFYFILLSHAPGEWQKYSVGRLHIQRLLEESFLLGTEEIDFTIGDEPYKLEWCHQSMELSAYKSYKTFSGFVVYGAFYIRLTGQKIINVLRSLAGSIRIHHETSMSLQFVSKNKL
jgi:CelD/BcsL family acetyltransferase involved in cellulose biosynthesis